MALRLTGTLSFDPPVLLAPMAGITDLPFRRLVARFGAGLVVSEMVAGDEVLRARPEARARAELGLDQAATAVQLAGRDPALLALAAQLVADMGARIIDINMGCPAKRVTAQGGHGACGSALMREPDHALRLIEAVVAAVDVPVTVKMRLGWDHDSLNAPDLARRAAGAGAVMVTVHGRTRCQFYTGRADWAAIAPTVRAAGVPVVANGDIVDAASARAALAASGAAGVMVGRGAQGAPWRLARIAADLGLGPAPVVPQGAALADLVVEHHEAMLSFYGRDLGLRVARKHLGWYLDAAGLTAARPAVVTAATPAATQAALRAAFADQPDQPDRRAA
ncbi:MAG: tRNA dihydrouridine synthase DusB [Rhodobacterales bacterium]|nr:tRNA dihydrouridine synthase DusB [Rhodobacterales bacterium]